ncbi:hypothetical protein Trydic_g19777 [Trypoxylus dichotomus]
MKTAVVSERSGDDDGISPTLYLNYFVNNVYNIRAERLGGRARNAISTNKGVKRILESLRMDVGVGKL